MNLSSLKPQTKPLTNLPICNLPTLNLHAEPAEAPTLESEANSTLSTFEASAKKVNLQSLRKNTYLQLPISFYF